MKKRGRPPLSNMERMRSRAWAHAVINYKEAPNIAQAADAIGMPYTTFYSVANGIRSAQQLIGVVPEVKEVYERGPYGAPLWAALQGDEITNADIGHRLGTQTNFAEDESEDTEYFSNPLILYRQLSLYVALYWQELLIERSRRVHIDRRDRSPLFRFARLINHWIDKRLSNEGNLASEYGIALGSFGISKSDMYAYLPDIGDYLAGPDGTVPHDPRTMKEVRAMEGIATDGEHLWLEEEHIFEWKDDPLNRLPPVLAQYL